MWSVGQQHSFTTYLSLVMYINKCQQWLEEPPSPHFFGGTISLPTISCSPKKANYISLVSVLILEQMKATPVELTEATPVRVPWRPILSRPLGPSAAQPAAAQSVSRALSTALMRQCREKRHPCSKWCQFIGNNVDNWKDTLVQSYLSARLHVLMSVSKSSCNLKTNPVLPAQPYSDVRLLSSVRIDLRRHQSRVPWHPLLNRPCGPPATQPAAGKSRSVVLRRWDSAWKISFVFVKVSIFF